MSVIETELKSHKYAGHYQIGGSQGLGVYLDHRPIWIHRVMMKLCLGWEWIDSN